jgi:hypothetical protein
MVRCHHHRKFRHRLRNYDTLVFSGYGRGEKGIDIRINQWLPNGEKNRVIVLHGNGADELRRKKFGYWKWNGYHTAKKVIVVEKWFKDCTAEELQKLVNR